jgi:hypothetical protein
MTSMLVRSLIALMLLSACAAAPQEQSLLLVHGPAEAVGPTPARCYSTLAEPDCFTQRNLEARDRLIGAYVPVEPSAEPAPD